MDKDQFFDINLINDIIDGTAEKTTADAFFRHAEECSKCNHLYSETKKLRDALREEAKPSDGFTERTMERIRAAKKPTFIRIVSSAAFRMAAAAAACVVLGVFVFRSGLIGKLGNDATKDSIAKVTGESAAETPMADSSVWQDSPVEETDGFDEVLLMEAPAPEEPKAEKPVQEKAFTEEAVAEEIVTEEAEAAEETADADNSNGYDIMMLTAPTEIPAPMAPPIPEPSSDSEESVPENEAIIFEPESEPIVALALPLMISAPAEEAPFDGLVNRNDTEMPEAPSAGVANADNGGISENSYEPPEAKKEASGGETKSMVTENSMVPTEAPAPEPLDFSDPDDAMKETISKAASLTVCDILASGDFSLIVFIPYRPEEDLDMDGINEMYGNAFVPVNSASDGEYVYTAYRCDDMNLVRNLFASTAYAGERTVDERGICIVITQSVQN